jgi:hypothetical protein
MIIYLALLEILLANKNKLIRSAKSTIRRNNTKLIKKEYFSGQFHR